MCVSVGGQLGVKLSPDSLGSVSRAAVGLSDTFPLRVEVCVWARGVSPTLRVSLFLSHTCTGTHTHTHTLKLETI